MIRRAYLAAFAPRYAYILYHCLNKVAARARRVLADWNNGEAVLCMMGGGPACELVGLLDWLYQNDIRPRYLHVVMLDRENYWRTFHSFLFSELLGQQFRRTLIVPTYESVEFPVPRGSAFNRQSVNYNFAQTSLLAEAKMISIVNCLSELSNHRGFECHLRFLTRLAWTQQLIVCADSAARKRRPRMKWLADFFNDQFNFESTQLWSGTPEMHCNWLRRGQTSQRIFSGQTPRWETAMSRWVYIQCTGP